MKPVTEVFDLSRSSLKTLDDLSLNCHEFELALCSRRMVGLMDGDGV